MLMNRPGIWLPPLPSTHFFFLRLFPYHYPPPPPNPPPCPPPSPLPPRRRLWHRCCHHCAMIHGSHRRCGCLLFGVPIYIASIFHEGDIVRFPTPSCPSDPLLHPRFQSIPVQCPPSLSSYYLGQNNHKRRVSPNGKVWMMMMMPFLKLIMKFVGFYKFLWHDAELERWIGVVIVLA